MYRLTIRIRSDDTVRPNTNTLFGPHFPNRSEYEANIRYISSWEMRSVSSQLGYIMHLETALTV